jgi:hypothetical protein
MKNSKYYAFLALMGLLASDGYPLHKKWEEGKQDRRFQKQIPEKGLRKWNIDGIEVWAINEKNAIRKITKLKLKNENNQTNLNSPGS